MCAAKMPKSCSVEIRGYKLGAREESISCLVVSFSHKWLSGKF